MLRLALPIIAGMAGQIVLNLVDTAMVGRLGATPQAAVGLSSFTFLMLATVVTCLGTGVQAIVSRREGEGERQAAAAALDTGLCLSAAIGLPMGYLLAQATPALFELLSDDPEVIYGNDIYSGGSEYLAIRLLALGVLGANFCFRGFYNGIGRSGVYMVSIVLIQALNILFNWIFIFGNLGAPVLEVRGAAIASVTAQVVGTCFYTFLTLLQADVRRDYQPFRLKRLRSKYFTSLARLAWPDAIRSAAVLISMTLFLKLHGEVSTHSLAAGTILLNIGSAGFLVALGMGFAGATLVGQALGRGQPGEARGLVWLGIRLCLLILLPAVIAVAIWTVPILKVFSQDPITITIATPALRLFTAIAMANVVPIVLMHSLLGAGETRWVAKVQIAQMYMLMLPLAALLGLWLPQTLGYQSDTAAVFGLWTGLALSRALIALAVVPRFQGDRWERVAL